MNVMRSYIESIRRFINALVLWPMLQPVPVRIRRR
jgi:hypothetical protein